jgi:hypothetical protein
MILILTLLDARPLKKTRACDKGKSRIVASEYEAAVFSRSMYM